ncbi:MAG TPA: DUF952 domain-containing protein [Vicinamibacterales bacterium]
MDEPTIYHITTQSAWRAAREASVYRAESLETEGFIHCSEERQLAWVLQKHFSGRTGLLLLHIDPTRLDADVKYENLEGGTELFPHVYGPIPVTAVVEVSPLRT